MDILSDGTVRDQPTHRGHTHHEHEHEHDHEHGHRVIIEEPEHEPEHPREPGHVVLGSVAHYTCLDCGQEWDAASIGDAEIPTCGYCGEPADLWISLSAETAPAVPLCLSCALAASRKIADAVGNMLDSLNTADEDPADEHETDSAPAAARSSAPTPIPIPIPIPGGNRATRRAAMRRRHQPVPLRRVRKGKRP